MFSLGTHGLSQTKVDQNSCQIRGWAKKSTKMQVFFTTEICFRGFWTIFIFDPTGP